MKGDTTRTKKRKHLFLKILAVLVIVIEGLFLTVLMHPQIIVGAIQGLSGEAINTKNLYEPLGDPLEGTKANGQYIITEINYSGTYPNSYLDITYPDADRSVQRPTLIYFHGGGFFGGSKSIGDPPCGK